MPFFVRGVICLVSSVSVCTEKKKREDEEKKKREDEETEMKMEIQVKKREEKRRKKRENEKVPIPRDGGLTYAQFSFVFFLKKKPPCCRLT